MTTGPAFTESELAEARSRIQVRQLAESAAALLAAWQAGVAREAARFAEQMRQAERAAAERRRRVDAAEQFLLAGGKEKP